MNLQDLVKTAHPDLALKIECEEIHKVLHGIEITITPKQQEDYKKTLKQHDYTQYKKEDNKKKPEIKLLNIYNALNIITTHHENKQLNKITNTLKPIIILIQKNEEKNPYLKYQTTKALTILHQEIHQINNKLDFLTQENNEETNYEEIKPEEEQT